MIANIALSVAMLAVFALAVGGVVLLRRGERQKGLLMIAAAIVILANVLIWAMPLPAR
ncbi:MAG: hypothetical protein ABR601_04610 [Parasphingopyxis sp.]|nr:hypothetical protein [Sphingomonadales bacterium]